MNRPPWPVPQLMTHTEKPPRSASRLMVGGQVFDYLDLSKPSLAEPFQAAMEIAREKFGHALCLCRRQPLKLQLRLRMGKFHLAVWPNEGPHHDTECAFFRDDLWVNPNIVPAERQDPARLALQPTPADPRVAASNALKATQPSSGAASAPAAPSEPVKPPRRQIMLAVPGQRDTEPRAPDAPAQRPLNLRALAMGLWEEAALCRWHTSWTRDWGRARYELQRVAGTLDLNGQPLDEMLFVPRPFREGAKEKLNNEWEEFVRRLGNRTRGNPLYLLIAPVRSFANPGNGSPEVMHLRHLRHPVGLSDASLDFIQKDCKTALRQVSTNLADIRAARQGDARADDPRNPEVIGFFLAEANSRGGVFARAAWLMNVHPRTFIPANSRNAVMLVDALIDRGYSFQRLQSEVQPMRRTSPDWLVRHVIGTDGKPMARAALDMLDRGSSSEYLQSRHRLAQEMGKQGLPTWTWVPSGPFSSRTVPMLPPRDEMTPAEIQRALATIALSPDADFQYGPSPRFST